MRVLSIFLHFYYYVTKEKTFELLHCNDLSILHSSASIYSSPNILNFKNAQDPLKALDKFILGLRVANRFIMT